MSATLLHHLASIGQSVWIDALSRAWLRSGHLRTIIEQWPITGLTSNPTIFLGALHDGDVYHQQLRSLTSLDAEAAMIELMAADIREACDLLLPTHAATAGQDGHVSVEISPRLSHDADATVAEAHAWVERINRPNLMVKVPGTSAGITALEELTASGVNVNVTLLFSPARYTGVFDAHVRGLHRRADAGADIRSVASVASFFVSRVDAAVDAELDALVEAGSLSERDDTRLRGRAGIANALQAYDVFRRRTARPATRELIERGGHVQRPLWASTGVKDPSYPATMYVAGLALPQTVDTMPEATMNAAARASSPSSDRDLGQRVAAAAPITDELESLGISLHEVAARLEEDGLQRFLADERALLEIVQERLGTPAQ